MHWASLCRAALHYVTLHRTSLKALNCTALHCTVHSIVHSSSLKLFLPLFIKQHNALFRTELCSTALYFASLHFSAMHCAALHCDALHFTALHFTLLHCLVLHCTSIYIFHFCRNRKQCLVNQGCPCRKCLLIYCNNREFNVNHAINTKIVGEDNDWPMVNVKTVCWIGLGVGTSFRYRRANVNGYWPCWKPGWFDLSKKTRFTLFLEL